MFYLINQQKYLKLKGFLLFYEWIKDLSRKNGKVRTEKQIDSLK